MFPKTQYKTETCRRMRSCTGVDVYAVGCEDLIVSLADLELSRRQVCSYTWEGLFRLD